MAKTDMNVAQKCETEATVADCKDTATTKRIKVIGNNVILHSTIKFKDMKALKKHNPKALILTDEDKNEYFRIDIGADSINNNGATFNSADKNGYAILTFKLADTVKNKKEYITENYTGAISNIAKIEAQATDAIDTLNKAFKSITNAIEEE